MPDSLTFRPFKQAASIADRLRNNDAAVITISGHPISANEVHAVAFGSAGYLLGRLRRYDVAALMALAAIFLPDLQPGDGAFGTGYLPSIGLLTIIRESWYFVASLFVSFLIGLAHAE